MNAYSSNSKRGSIASGIESQLEKQKNGGVANSLYFKSMFFIYEPFVN